MVNSFFEKRKTVEQVEEGNVLAPKFNKDSLIVVTTMDVKDNQILMVGYMNKEALKKTIETKEAHYFSRSRNSIWRKGETSGLVQRVKKILIDDDQDALAIYVDVVGIASCHVGYRSCFYRSVDLSDSSGPSGPKKLIFEESKKIFDPVKIYGKHAENPTKL